MYALIHQEYQNIVEHVIQQAKKGKTELKFNVLCHHWDPESEYTSFAVPSRGPDIRKQMQIYNLTGFCLDPSVINKLNETFPDSYISPIHVYHNCPYHIIQW